MEPNMSFRRMINLFVSLSNLPGLLIIFDDVGNNYKIILTAMVGISILMHLSEKKHGLPGIYPFNKFSSFFLNVDRMFAVLCSIIVLFKAIPNFEKISGMTKFFSFFGLFCGGISELYDEYQEFEYLLTHSIWHWSAYYVFRTIVAL